ncbi:MAG: alpha-1,4-glucan--maltose-1-phosphate maltosyltransferase [Bacteroidetes bacterium]|nr:alpha-1,4-glucan--maltose-1-phosphate maltosyltransferase [Bacteroidota bacterium]
MPNGQQRIIIENIQPLVDGGLYPAKRTVGEKVEVRASIFADGHDHIRASLWVRSATETNPAEILMVPTANDEWQASFYTLKQENYFFSIHAWIDHFDTWYDGFKKKVAARVDVKVELMEGASMLRQLSLEKPELILWATKLEDSSHYAEAVASVLSDEFEKIVYNHPLKEIFTTSGKELEILVESKKANFSTWYEFFPRSSALDAGRHGTFRDCLKLLPRISAMGFDVLYFPPIHPIGKINRKGKNNNVRAVAGEPGSPWAIGSDEGGHKSVLPALGTIEDFKKLVSEAKKMGIDIAMDIAFQCAPDHPYVKEHKSWFKQRPDGSIQYAENPPKKYQDIYPFNFETEDWQALWQELLSVFLFWMEQGVKIFRVDNPHTKPIPFWHWVIAEVHKTDADIIFLSEAFTRPKIMESLAKVGFTQSYTYFTWRVNKSELTNYMKELVQGPSRNFFRPNFWPNTPDILPYHLQHQAENSFIIRYALAATLSSNVGVYGPSYEFYENTPIDGKEEYYNSEKYEVRHYDWKKTNRMTDIMTMINRVRKENTSLQSTWNIQFCEVGNDQLIAFLKATDDLSNLILVVVNLDPHQTQSGYIQLPKERIGLADKINIKLYDWMTDEHYTWIQEWNFVEINPHKMPFHLFQLSIHQSHM